VFDGTGDEVGKQDEAVAESAWFSDAVIMDVRQVDLLYGR